MNRPFKQFIIWIVFSCINQMETIHFQYNTNSALKKFHYKIEQIPHSFAEMGEGPHWDADTQSLFYVNIDFGKLLRYDYRTNRVYECKIEGEELAGFIIPIEGTKDLFVVGCERRILIIKWNGYSNICTVYKELFKVEQSGIHYGNRFNDGKCDPHGRLVAGTMRYIDEVFDHRLGKLYQFNGLTGHVSVLKDSVGISNGLAWNERIRKMYFADTKDFNVLQFNYNVISGVASNPRVVYKWYGTNYQRPNNYFSQYLQTSPRHKALWNQSYNVIKYPNPIQPDGMTIDVEGNIYVAMFNGSSIYKINPSTGQVLMKLKFPTNHITSCAFGGPNLNILYVTTSSIKEPQPPPGGSLFKVTGLGTRGLPANKFKLNFGVF